MANSCPPEQLQGAEKASGPPNEMDIAEVLSGNRNSEETINKQLIVFLGTTNITYIHS